MKKLRLSLQQLSNTEVLTRDQLKTLYGGDGSSGGSGSCVACYCGTMTSCYYTSSPSTLCERVYPNCSEDVYASPVLDCNGCIMN